MVAEVILAVGMAYTALGAVVAAAFLSWGIGRIDPAARGAYLFRVLLVPGAVGLWPLVLYRWRALARGEGETRPMPARHRRAHGLIWLALAALLPLGFALGLLARQERSVVVVEPRVIELLEATGTAR